MSDPIATKAATALRERITSLDNLGLDLLFREARTYNGWLDKPVEDALLRRLVDIAKMGPTSANSSPLRILFVKSQEAKEKLKPCLAPGNVDKTMAAPVCAIFGNDLAFYEHMPRLFPRNPAYKDMFASNKALAEATAQRNAVLQAAYVMLAARAIGLDCGPMSGFDAAKLDAAFWGGTTVKSNFICNIGYGDPHSLLPRGPRFAFDEFCKII
ncbi:MAG: malonic semialdehyde reductase [Alphaproteobacteria bacterium]